MGVTVGREGGERSWEGTLASDSGGTWAEDLEGHPLPRLSAWKAFAPHLLPCPHTQPAPLWEPVNADIFLFLPDLTVSSSWAL